jgi:hypothetical protein
MKEAIGGYLDPAESAERTQRESLDRWERHECSGDSGL